MRIAVVDVLPMGGAKRVVFEHIRGLARRHDILYCTTQEDLGFDFASIKNLKIKQFPFTKTMKDFSWMPYDLKLFSRLLPLHFVMMREVEKFNTDVVLAHPDLYTQAPFLMSLLEKIPMVYFAEEWYRIVYEDTFKLDTRESLPVLMREWLHRKVLQTIDRVNIGQATRVITTSEFNKKNLKKAYGVETEVLPLGVDSNVFTPGVTDERRNYFLFVGEKDVIHGYPLLEKTLHQSQLPFNVKVVSFKNNGFGLSEAALIQAYQHAVAVICLDVNEPFGLVPIEAMACGTAVIGIKEGGYLETIVDGETGILIERNTNALEQAMKTLATDSLIRKRMEENGRKRVLEHFNWKNHIKKLEEVLDETAQKH